MTRLQTDIPSDRLIIARDDDPLENRGAHRRYQSIGGSNPSGPILSLNERKRIESGQHTVLCECCGGEIVLVIGDDSLLTESLTETLNQVDDGTELIIGT